MRGNSGRVRPALPGALRVFGVIDMVLAVMLLRDADNLPVTLKMFGIANLLFGISQASVILSFATVIMYPIATLMLAVHFPGKPNLIEIV
ncbi:MAG: hypothetical protein QF921_11105 [Pseudomonadales bacterium]|nr:hypothetical protein [Pseudomonadales bacterium]MDP6470593.1 hypothetical protein [Pseudomonadales bacterium]MDP6828552.1 hypothetical protein [Pseudomonadales bacterium]MDP6972038.1 hypothetical protein [Pseudomonadales bacterium]